MTDLLKDPEAFLATVADLLRKAGQDRELDILANSEADLREIENDSEGVYYSLVLSVTTELYARYESKITEIEAAIRKKGEIVLRGHPWAMLGGVVIAPAPVESRNWRGITYKMPLRELLEEIEAERGMLVSVSTGGPRIQSVNAEYVERRERIRQALAERRIDDPNPYGDLWAWYGKWSADLPGYQSRRSFVAEMYAPLLSRVREERDGNGHGVIEEPTGWAKVDRGTGEIRRRLGEATTEEQFQAVGLLCREAMISLAQVVYDPERHPSVDGETPSETDAKRMLEAFLGAELKGHTNETARRHARAALDLANELTHKRTALFRLAALCVEATISVINLAAIVSGQRDPDE